MARPIPREAPVTRAVGLSDISQILEPGHQAGSAVIAAAKDADENALGRPVVQILNEHDAKHLVIDERFKNVAIALEATRDIFEAQQ